MLQHLAVTRGDPHHVGTDLTARLAGLRDRERRADLARPFAGDGAGKLLAGTEPGLEDVGVANQVVRAGAQRGPAGAEGALGVVGPRQRRSSRPSATPA